MRPSIFILTACPLLGLVQCGTPALTSVVKPGTNLEAASGQSTCPVAKDPLNPLIVEWPGTSKTELDTASQQGIVIVSYVGCILKVLTGCQAQGSYELKRSAPNYDFFDIEDEAELDARLPLGVASLKGELAQGRKVSLEYVSVGQRVAVKPPVTLLGTCAGATHYVRSVTVGAYQLETRAKGQLTAGAQVGGATVGGVKREQEVRRRGTGDVSKCKSGTGSANDCGALLQLGLAPLYASGDKATTAGFGEGLGAITVVPSVSEFQGTVATGGLADADPGLLETLQTAKRTDKDAQQSPTQRADAWDRLARYQGKNPYREMAEQRRDRWRAVAEAQAKRETELQRAWEQYQKDNAKLQGLLALDDDVVSPAQKEAYKRELAQVYAPWRAAIDQRVREAAAREAAAREAAAREAAAREAAAREAAAREAALAEAAFRAAGLVWQKQPAPNEMNWESAKSYCQGLALAGGGWRLPSKDELLALYATKASGTASFPGMNYGRYWSSSAVSGSSGNAWYVNFYYGATLYNDVGSNGRVRCVR